MSSFVDKIPLTSNVAFKKSCSLNHVSIRLTEKRKQQLTNINTVETLLKDLHKHLTAVHMIFLFENVLQVHTAKIP